MAGLAFQRSKLPTLLDLKTEFLKFMYERLFRNDHTPGPDDDASMYQEATFLGYGAISPIPSFPAFLNSDGLGQANMEPQEFTCTSAAVPNTIYGFFVTDATGELWYAARFDSPIVVNTPGQVIPVNVTWYERQMVSR